MIQRSTQNAIEVEIDLIDFNEHNPNEMSDIKFNALVERISSQGFRHPIEIIINPERQGRYKLIAGEHRLKSMKVLGETTIPAYIDEYDADKAKFEIVKDNMLRGKMSPKKFTELVNSLSTKYSNEALAQFMAMEESEFDRYYKAIRDSLDPEMKKKLDAVKNEIKTIDGLAKVLNRLFSEYGSTLTQNFMVFDYGGQKHLWIQADKELWEMSEIMRMYCERTKLNLADTVKKLFNGSIKLLDMSQGGTSEHN